jgi:hypothetical protein
VTTALRTGIGILLFLVSPATVSAQDTVISGVTVTFKADETTFPKRWHRKKINALATPVETAAIPRAMAVVGKSMSKYPSSFPASYLKTVHVIKTLRFYGYPYGGTYAKRTLYLTLDDTNPMNTDGFLEERFHHEFSSILWKENHKLLDLEKWQSFNPPGFVYGEGGMDAIRSGLASMETDPGYFAIGFINRYGITEIEQDINVIAQNLFCGGTEFWKIVDQNERIRGRVLLLVGFYHALDPLFTEEYFRNLNEF